MARDYYPQGPSALADAIQEHISRGDRLRSVLKELEAMGDAIVEAE
jgi:hypothetical protein